MNMTCSALAEPGATFTWIKDNKTLEPNEDIQIYNSDHHSSLQLHIYDDSVFGGYECRATNMLGTMARVIVLEEAVKPSAPHFTIKVIYYLKTFIFKQPIGFNKSEKVAGTSQEVKVLTFLTWSKGIGLHNRRNMMF